MNGLLYDRRLNGLLVFSLLATTLLLAAGCGLGNTAQAGSTPPVKKSTTADTAAKPPARDILISQENNSSILFSNTSCVHPAGWQAYYTDDGDTAIGLAGHFGTTVEALLRGNCLANPAEIASNRLIYVPQFQNVERMQTVLPLGVNQLIAEPTTAQPGGSIRLHWQGQGSVVSARVGIVFNGLFYEQAKDLPVSGTIDLSIPDDGREYITYMIRVSDGGEREIAAQTTIRVSCREGWFFAPQPPGCPSSPLVTTFQEQQFERGTIVYVPALGMHYVMVAGQEAVMMNDDFVPGMPLRDVNLAV
ncbi:MAG TPA: hypothetical protein VJZ27_02460, partial [Aggregatilineales bacterium]|nr:hypothetical protein [Aggregatilineales bacterium]